VKKRNAEKLLSAARGEIEVLKGRIEMLRRELVLARKRPVRIEVVYGQENKQGEFIVDREYTAAAIAGAAGGAGAGGDRQATGKAAQ
jgi:hypothetical protein